MEIKQRDNLKLSNTFIEAKCDKMTKDEQNFLYLCISQIDKSDKEFSMMRIHLNDIQQLALVRKNYKQVRTFINDLRKKGVQLYDGKKYMPRNFFHRLNYIEGTGYIEAQLHEDLHELCLELKKNFTQASLMSCISFRSKYSSPLYLLLKSVYDKQKKYQDYIFVDYEPSYLLEHFQLPKSYKIYNNLKQKFLEVTEKDISDNSEFNISFTPVKKGRNLEAIRFTITKKEDVNSSLDMDKFSLDFDKSDLETRVLNQFDNQIKKAISDMQLDSEKLEELLNKFDFKDVEQGIYTLSKLDMSFIKNKHGYLEKIIENKVNNRK